MPTQLNNKLSAPKQPLAKRKTVLRLIGLAILSYFVIVPVIRSIYLTFHLPALANSTLEQSKDQKIEDHKQTIDRARKLFFLDQTSYSAAYNVCYTHSAGVLSSSYSYVCRISFVDFFQTPLPLNASNTDQNSRGYGSVSYHDYLHKLTDRINLDVPRVDMHTTKRSADNVNEIIDNKLKTNGRIISDKLGRMERIEKIYHTGSEILDPNKRYLILTQDSEYLDENIGCAFNAPLVCYSPFWDY